MAKEKFFSKFGKNKSRPGFWCRVQRLVMFRGGFMVNTVEFHKTSLNIKEFEEGNDLTKDTHFSNDTHSGTFILSDGEEYG